MWKSNFRVERDLPPLQNARAKCTWYTGDTTCSKPLEITQSALSPGRLISALERNGNCIPPSSLRCSGPVPNFELYMV